MNDNKTFRCGVLFFCHQHRVLLKTFGTAAQHAYAAAFMKNGASPNNFFLCSVANRKWKYLCSLLQQ